MLLTRLIDALTAIEQRHTGQPVEVEVFDDHGIRTGGFSVKTEYVFPAKRTTVLLLPPTASDGNEDGRWDDYQP
jgi:hypothetical protein